MQRTQTETAARHRCKFRILTLVGFRVGRNRDGVFSAFRSGPRAGPQAFAEVGRGRGLIMPRTQLVLELISMRNIFSRNVSHENFGILGGGVAQCATWN